MAHFGSIVRLAQAQAVLREDSGDGAVTPKGRQSKAKLQAAVLK